MSIERPEVVGYKLVPIVPTRAMLEAVDDQDEDPMVARGRAVDAWSAMIAACDAPVATLSPPQPKAR